MNTQDFITSALQLGLESENASTTLVTNTGPVHDVENITDAIEIDELYNEVASTTAEVSRLETAAKALDAIVEASEGATLISVTDLPSVNATLETICSTVGIESLGLEGVQENLMKLWEAIKAFIEKLIVSVSNFFASIFGGFQRLAKQAEELRTKAFKHEGVTAGEGKLTNANYGQYLQYKTSMSPASIAEGLHKTSTVIDQTFESVKRSAGLLAEDMARAAVKLMSDSKAESVIDTTFTNEYTSEEMSGGYSIHPSKAGTPYTLFYEIKVADREFKGDIEKATRVEVAQMAMDIIRICDMMAHKKETIKNINVVYNRIISKTHDILTAKHGEFGSMGRLRTHLALSRSVIHNYSDTLTKLSKISFSICRAGLSYGERSLAK